MKFKICLFLLFSFLFNSVHAQQSTDTTIRTIYSTAIKKNFVVDNLYLLGKIWGFLKYYHPEIAAGKYDWDKELIEFLPGYTNVKSLKERNDSLENWINRFGKISVCESCNDSILMNAKLKPDFSWISNSEFSPALVETLENIKNNRIQSGQYYTKFQSQDGINMVLFQHEPGYSNIKFPNDSYGLLSVFRFWNIINYWYPYKYNLPVKWGTILKQFIKKMLAHEDEEEYTLLIEGLITAIHDSHGYYRNAITDEIAGKYYLPFTVKIVENKIFVTSILNDSLAALSNVKVGDIIESINDKKLAMIIEDYKNIIPASNEGSYLDKLSYRITRNSSNKTNIIVKRNNKIFQTQTYNYIPKFYPPVDLNPPYFSYQKDSSFCVVSKGIGYINVGRFNRKDSVQLGQMIHKVSKLIIDNRQNQDEQKGTGGGDIIAEMILSPDNKFARFSTLQPSYPGVFTLTEPTNMGLKSNEHYFKGDIRILTNEGTISVGEFLTMAFQKAPKAKTLGATTAGADGNVTYITLPGGIFVQFTGLGVYYPNGAETQRVGIKPDILVRPTIDEYRKFNDEQLSKAIEYLQKTD